MAALPMGEGSDPVLQIFFPLVMGHYGIYTSPPSGLLQFHTSHSWSQQSRDIKCFCQRRLWHFLMELSKRWNILVPRN